MDYVEEELALYNEINDPPDYVIHTPELFDNWHKWAVKYKAPEEDEPGLIKPLGEKIGPDWIKWEFEGLEEFYQFYKKLIGEM